MSQFELPEDILDKYRFLEEYNIATDYRDILNTLEHEVYVVDEFYVIVFANAKAIERFGNDIIGKKCKQVRSGREPYELCEHCPVTEVFSGKKLGYIGNLKAIDKNGTTYYYSETATPLLNNYGTIALVVLICRDMTKRHDIENIIKKFPKVQLDFYQYGQYVKYVVNELQKVGYNRIRFYQVVNDTIRNDKILVMRESYGMNGVHKHWHHEINTSDLGYRFYLNDSGYQPLKIDGINIPKLFRYEEVIIKYPDYICIDDLEFKNISWLNLPMIVDDELIALLSLDNKGKEDVCNEDLNLLTELTEYLSQAFKAFQAEMNLRHLDHINKLINEKRYEGDILEVVSKETRERLQAGMCGIILYSDTGGKLIWSTKDQEKSDITFQGTIYNDKDLKSAPEKIIQSFPKGWPINLINLSGLMKDNSLDFDIRTIDYNVLRKFQNAIVRESGSKFEIQNAILAPLVFEDDIIGFIGVANNLWDGRYPFSDSEVALMSSIASQIAVAAQYDRMRDEIDIAIVDITESISDTDYKVDEVAKEIVKTIRKVSKAKIASLLLVDEEKQNLNTIAIEGISGMQLKILNYRMNTDRTIEFGIPLWVARNNRVFIANSRIEQKNHPAFEKRIDTVFHYADEVTQSLLVIPLRFNNEVIGVLRVDDPEPNRFTKSIKTICFTLANFAAVAISSAQDIERREDFFISFGHEIGLPATALQGLSEVMERRYIHGDDIESENGGYITIKKKPLINYCENLLTETNHLRFLTKGRAALDQGAKYELENLNLTRIIKEVISILQSAAKWKQIDIELDARVNIRLPIDREKLKQALYNVIYNAIKYSPNNSNVEITVRQEKDKVIIDIIDNGIGVKKGDENKIFLKDFRGDNAYAIDPTGLGRGLFYAKMIIENHNGTIMLTNHKNPTIFTIIFEDYNLRGLSGKNPIYR
ncbi:MAG: GAF domain-containing protein [candidate division Zixibacteria bacterium]|nr:GAF domain-containing protein [candidate division Zixibacteria bacterium]